MDAVFENNVLETSASTGTGAMTLAQVPGFRRFRDALTVGKPCHYVIKAVDVVGRPTGEFETGFGVYSANDTLTRTAVVESSAANAFVNFVAGAKTVAFTSLAPNTLRAREDWQSALQLNFAGAVAYCAASVPPDGWLKCNGAAVSRSTYARLFSRIGTQYGAGDGQTTFALPDLRGEFIRSWDDGRTLDKDRTFASVQPTSNLWHMHGLYDPGHAHGVSDNGHAHSVYDPGHGHSAWTDVQGHHDHARGVKDAGGGYSLSWNDRFVNEGVIRGMDGNYRTEAGGQHGHNVGVGANGTGIGIYASGVGIGIQAAGTGQAVQYDGGNESRPRNVALLAVIKF